MREGHKGHLWARGRMELRSLQDLCNTSETDRLKTSLGDEKEAEGENI